MENSNKDTLAYLLVRSTAKVEVNGGMESGAGFFVAPGYLLTCAHVVAGANQGQGTIKIVWNRQKYSASIEQITDKAHPDLALLKIEGISNHPCVYLATDVQLQDDLYTYGYPEGPTNGDSIISEYIGPTGESEVLLTLAWSNVRPGFSGSPLLNLRTGAVCGLVKRTMGEGTVLGGRGVPIEHALEAFSSLKTWQKQFHTQDGQWASSLTPQQRQSNGLGKLVAQDEAVTLFFSYQDNPKDQKWVERLQKQLIVWQRNGIINAWHMGELEVGEAWEELSRQRLDSAQIILLLVSQDYTSDDNLYNLHVGRAMARRAAGEATVIPILVRPTAGWQMTPFGILKAAPSNGKPLSQWADEDLASMTVAQEIARVVEGIRKKKR